MMLSSVNIMLLYIFFLCDFHDKLLGSVPCVNELPQFGESIQVTYDT